jgi:integrase/recombinase XerC
MLKHNIAITLNTQRPDKNGLYPVRIRTIIKRVVTYYPTGIRVTEDQFLKGEIIKHPKKVSYNMELRKMVADLEDKLMKESYLGKEVVKSKRTANLTFGDYAKKKIEFWKSTQTKVTTDHKTSYLNKFLAFNPDIKLKDVTQEVIAKYEAYCRDLGNINNTVWSATKFVKTILNAAVEDEVLTKNPLKRFQGVKYIDPFRDTLSPDEIDKVEVFARNPLQSPKMLNVANWFLFSCYTGLRYGDLNNFKGFKNGKVLLQTEKTNEVVSIFATNKIVETKERLSKEVYSNQKMNDYLKIIMASLNIDKRVTCHTARHTFAVQFLERGGRIEILSTLLGHTSLKTTQIYAKISNPLADAEMKKVWDQEMIKVFG